MSTDRHAEEGHSLDAQEAAVREHAKANGLNLVRIVRGESSSEAVKDRPDLGELLDTLQPGTVLVVPRLDALARDLPTQEVLLRDIRERGAEVASCSRAEADSLADDPNDPTRKLIRQVLGAVADFERALVGLRLSRGRRAKAGSGGFAYGSPPFGMRAHDKRLVPDPKEQEALALARQLRDEGKSYRTICQALTEAGHKPRRGQHWYPTTVARILRRSV